MSQYRIEILRSAQKSLSKLSKNVQIRIIRKIDDLGMNPYPPDAKKLKNANENFRIRVGDYRVIYKIKDNDLVILVVKIAHRREVYE